MVKFMTSVSGTATGFCSGGKAVFGQMCGDDSRSGIVDSQTEAFRWVGRTNMMVRPVESFFYYIH